MKTEERFWAKVSKRPDGCWLWTGTTCAGYGAFYKDRKVVRAHRFSWEMANGRAVPDGMWVLHRCDVPGCVNPDHLWIGNAADNNADMMSKRRHVSGNAKFTEDQVRQIRGLVATGRSVASVARMYPFATYESVWKLVRRKTFNYIEENA